LRCSQRIFVTSLSLQLFTLRGSGGECRANHSLIIEGKKGNKVMSNAESQGKFVWHELLTTDSAAAAAFYTKVVAWKTQPWEQDASYSMWVAKNGPVGGLAGLGDSGAAHWLSYVGVPDVAATIEAAKGLGAKVVKGATDLPSGGTYAVLADPQGAEFGVYASTATSDSDSAAPGPGEFTWHELATSDARAAMEFYTKLFGWEVGPVHDMGPAGDYHLFLRGGNQYGGMYVSDNQLGGPSWLCYIGVEDAGKAAAAAKAAGGRVLNGPMEVPGGSWVAQVMDREGAAFAVHESRMAATAKPAEKAAAKPAKAKPAKAAANGGAASSITKPPATESTTTGGAASSITKPPATESTTGGAASSITKPPRVRSTGGAASSITKPPAAASLSASAPAKSAAKKGKKKAAPAKKAAAKKSAKKAAPAAKRAPAKKAGKSAAKGKAKGAAKKAAGKKKSAAKRAPAKKKASRGKAKKHR
jgi:predicted enzyme related to lactoylglutathione lyase